MELNILNAPFTYHPTLNEAAEQLVQTFKQILKSYVHKGRSTQQGLCDFLLSDRNTLQYTTN